VDREALAAAHVNGVAGACLAIGIRYAGSANADAQALLQECALGLLHAKEAAPDSSAGAHGSLPSPVPWLDNALAG
jgi:anaphase-promoting complex subunit 1